MYKSEHTFDHPSFVGWDANYWADPGGCNGCHGLVHLSIFKYCKCWGMKSMIGALHTINIAVFAVDTDPVNPRASNSPRVVRSGEHLDLRVSIQVAYEPDEVVIPATLQSSACLA